ncbi:MAG: TonB-dependent receptor [Rikenellaceae bacterium]|jgi:hypothetical protein|nr:TonB-dependent receptor [Rikenellaceae bacterium]
MTIRRTIITLILSGLALSVASGQQRKATVSGAITDRRTGETLIGVSVARRGPAQKQNENAPNARSNEYGFYSLTLAPGTHILTYSYTGYAPQTVEIELQKDTTLNMALDEASVSIDNITVRAERRHDNVLDPQTGIEHLEVRALERMPVLFGERDVMKSLQLLPGVRNVGEGSSGLTVRGGTADQNLILLDEANVYNASHLMGFFSTFNSDAIKDVTLYKGTAPAQFGGRLASVVDVKMNDGNNRRFGASGGIGLIASRLAVEGPIKKERGSFIVSARRTYADLFLALSSDSAYRGSRLYFYDINAKANYQLGKRDRLFLSGYFGRDVMGYRDMFGIDWGNATGTLRWNHIFGPRLFSNTSFIVSDYSYKVGISNDMLDLAITSRIRDINLRQEFQWFPSERHKLTFGLNTVYHTIVPGQISAPTITNIPRLERRYSWENALFASGEWRATPQLRMIYGLRLATFSVLGPGRFYTYDNQGEATDSVSYGRGRFVKTYVSPEPRLSLNYVIGPRSSLKVGYARNSQFLHLLSNSFITSPTDMWLPASNNIRPGVADQLSLGYFRNMFSDALELSVEGYCKFMSGQIDYRDGADIQANEKVEGELLTGRGRAYGLEILLRKPSGRLNGWAGYTIARSERSIDGINAGRWYPARQDCTHDVSIVANYLLSTRWELSLNWVFTTGNAVTYPSGKYNFEGRTYYYYTERNGYRLPPSHRLDIGATWYVKRTATRESSWNFSLYNAYGRRNPFMIDFRQSEADPKRTEAVQISLFRWVPSFTYNFKFR